MVSTWGVFDSKFYRLQVLLLTVRTKLLLRFSRFPIPRQQRGAKVQPRKVHALQIGLSKNGSGNVSPRKLAPFTFTPRKFTLKGPPTKTHLPEIRPQQLRPAQFRPRQIGPRKSRLGHIAFANVRVIQLGPGKIRKGQTRIPQVRIDSFAPCKFAYPSRTPFRFAYDRSAPASPPAPLPHARKEISGASKIAESFLPLCRIDPGDFDPSARLDKPTVSTLSVRQNCLASHRLTFYKKQCLERTHQRQ